MPRKKLSTPKKSLDTCSALSINVHSETQGPSSGSSRTQGSARTHEEAFGGRAHSDCEPCSKGSLVQAKGKGRVRKGERMTRKSFQQGYIFPRQTARGTVHVIRYRIQTADGTWKHRAETVNSPRKKDAAKQLAERMREVNGGPSFRLILPSRSSPIINGRTM
jgi:hypothetical protein